MKRLIIAVAGCVSSIALAQGAPAAAGQAPKAEAAAAAPGMDMSKMGPWSRKPADEKKTKKEVEDFFKKDDEASTKGDMEGMLALIDFPVFMATDDAAGAVTATPTSKEDWIAEMKPFFENMPKDSKTTHKRNITILSDALANVSDEYTMTAGKNKMVGRSMGLIVKVGGSWKWKVMAEAGWGGMGPPKAEAKAAAAPAAAPAPAAKDAKPAPAAPAAAPGKK
ncbi:MAG: hypothetical protein JNJ54_25655 [Myxococcaceae bacterium]|nr:hypothetical protein [Myxococcaceae bacterium]